MVLFCLSSPCLLSYPPFPFLSTHLTQIFVSTIPWKFLLLKSTRTSNLPNLPNLRDNSQCSFFKDHSAARTELITHFFFLKHFPHLTAHSLGFFLSYWYFFSSPSRPLNVGGLQGPILRPPFHVHSLSQEVIKSHGLNIISLVVSLTFTASSSTSL